MRMDESGITFEFKREQLIAHCVERGVFHRRAAARYKTKVEERMKHLEERMTLDPVLRQEQGYSMDFRNMQPQERELEHLSRHQKKAVFFARAAASLAYREVFELSVADLGTLELDVVEE